VTAAEELLGLLEEIEDAGTSVMELARGKRPQQPWTLYPSEYGIFDRKTRSQFYYHSHAGAGHEAGHFHTVRLFPDHTAHLVAISVGENGWPQALFTVNRWSVGDAYERPESLKGYARRFRIALDRGPARLVQFINLMFQVFLPEIERLQDEKEGTTEAYGAAHPDEDPYEARGLEVLSRVEIDVRERVRRPGTVRRAHR
jgi:hypothetical protein